MLAKNLTCNKKVVLAAERREIAEEKQNIEISETTNNFWMDQDECNSFGRVTSSGWRYGHNPLSPAKWGGWPQTQDHLFHLQFGRKEEFRNTHQIHSGGGLISFSPQFSAMSHHFWWKKLFISLGKKVNLKWKMRLVLAIPQIMHKAIFFNAFAWFSPSFGEMALNSSKLDNIFCGIFWNSAVEWFRIWEFWNSFSPETNILSLDFWHFFN